MFCVCSCAWIFLCINVFYVVPADATTGCAAGTYGANWASCRTCPAGCSCPNNRNDQNCNISADKLSNICSTHNDSSAGSGEKCALYTYGDVTLCPSSHPNSVAGTGSINNCYKTVASVGAGSYITSGGVTYTCPPGYYCPGKTNFNAYYGTEYNKMSCPTLSGWTLVRESGWKTSSDCKVYKNTTSIQNCNAGRSVKTWNSQWGQYGDEVSECTECAANYYSNNGSCSPCGENATSTAGASYCTCKENYTVSQGYSANNWDSSDDKPGATCKLRKYTITYNLNGLSGTTPSQKPCGYNEECTVYKEPSNIQLDDTQIFLGWATSSTSHKATYTSSNISGTFTKNTTLYAIYVNCELASNYIKIYDEGKTCESCPSRPSNVSSNLYEFYKEAGENRNSIESCKLKLKIGNGGSVCGSGTNVVYKYSNSDKKYVRDNNYNVVEGENSVILYPGESELVDYCQKCGTGEWKMPVMEEDPETEELTPKIVDGNIVYACQACGAGHYSVDDNGNKMNTCASCEAGYYCPDGNRRIVCPKDTFSENDAAFCVKCAPDFSTFGVTENTNICGATEGAYGIMCKKSTACVVKTPTMCNTDCICHLSNDQINNKSDEEISKAIRNSICKTNPEAKRCKEQECINNDCQQNGDNYIYLDEAQRRSMCLNNEVCKNLLCGVFFEFGDNVKVKNRNRSVVRETTKQ